MKNVAIFCLLLSLVNENFAASIPDVEASTIPVRVIYEKEKENLHAKPQLSTEELKSAGEHLPWRNQVRDETTFVALGEASSSSSTTTTPIPTAIPAEEEEEEISNPNVVLLIQIAENIVYSGLDVLKDNLDRISQSTDRVPPINEQQWDRFNKTVNSLFSILYAQEAGKVPDGNVFGIIAIGFNNASSRFIQRYKNRANTNVTHLLSDGFASIKQNLETFAVYTSTKTPPVRDAETLFGQVFQDDQSQPSESLVQGALDQFGQAINNLNPFANRKPEESSPSIIQGFNQVISNLNPFPQQGEQTTGNPLIQGAQNVFNQVNQAISNLNPFSSPKPQTINDKTTPNPLIQGAQSVIDQFGQAINNLNPFQSTTGNPLQGIQEGIQQGWETVSSIKPPVIGQQDELDELVALD